MNIYETKERIEKFLEKEISHLVPEPYASIINEVLDKHAEHLNNPLVLPKEEMTNGNESTDAEPATADEPIYESTESLSTGTDGTATTSSTESSSK